MASVGEPPLLRGGSPTSDGTAFSRSYLMLALRLAILVALCVPAFLWMTLQSSASPEATDKAKKLVESFTKQVRPLDIAANRA